MISLFNSLILFFFLFCLLTDNKTFDIFLAIPTGGMKPGAGLFTKTLFEQKNGIINF
jgi:hypothetical protein